MATPPFIPNGSSSSGGGFFNSPLFSGILSTLGGVATGILGNMAANTQADAATNASNQAQQTLLSIYNQQRNDAAPYTLAGYGAINRLSDLLGINPQRYSSGTATGAPAHDAIPFVGSPSQWDSLQSLLSQGKVPSINHRFGSDVQFADDASFGRSGDYRLADGSMPSAGPGDNGIGWQTIPASPGTSGTAAMGTGLPSDFGSLNHDFSLADFSADPGYAFRQTEGQKAIERSAAARGSVLGGGTLKALTRYGQDTASQEFGNAFNRYQVNRTNKINPLLSLSNLGQVSAGQVANAGTNFGNNSSSLLYQGQTDAANARASGYASTANGINSGINSINNLSLLRQLGRV